MIFKNSTHLESRNLKRMIRDAINGWPCDKLNVSVRYSRGAEFSGTCCYTTDRIYVNLGRKNTYPYQLLTHIARPQSNRTHWWREAFSVELAAPGQLVLFVFLHEFYHWLVKKARRNVRQKEARCDRFATRVLVDHCGATVRDSAGRRVDRSAWDFQDLDGFVAAAREQPKRAARRPAKPRPIRPTQDKSPPAIGQQLLLFP
jgi:hypothetical protein